MSFSRIIGILGAIAGTAAAVAGPITNTIDPKIGAIIAIVGIGLTAFTERVQGGKSTP